jgi:hypothetical protein
MCAPPPQNHHRFSVLIRCRYGQLGIGNLEDQFTPVANVLLQEEAAKYTDTNFPGQPPPKMIKVP